MCHLVIRAEEQLTADTNTKTVEYLSTSSHPHIQILDLLPVSLHVEPGDTIAEPVLQTHDDQEGGEDDVGEDGDEVGELAIGLDPLD